MKNYSFFLLLFLFSVSLGQEKYLVFFKDKGLGENPSSEVIQKAKLLARESLTKRCLERRAKLKTPDIIDEYDFPVSKVYLEELQRMNIKIVHQLKWFNAVSAFLAESQKEVVEKLPFVKKVRRVKVFKFTKPNDIKPFKLQEQETVASALHKLNYGPSLKQLEFSDIPYLHDLNITGQGVLLGLMDTGFRWKENNVFKKVKVVAEHDFVFNDNVTANQPNDRDDQDTHGTEIFSIIGSFAEGDLIGSAYGASFVLAKTEDVRSETHVEEDNYAAALEWFENLGVDIASSSLGYNEFDKSTYSYTYEDMNGETTIVTRAAEIAFQKGMLVVTAAGNEGAMPWRYIIAPADGFNAIAVGALTADGSVATFSSRGPTADGRIKPDICALGVSVHAARPYGNLFVNIGGTSTSTPIVSGGAALILSAFPYLSNVQLRKIILETGDNSSTPNNTVGYGRFSALSALDYPNIKIVNDSIFVNKFFYFRNDSLTNVPTMFVSADGVDFTKLEGNKQGSYLYSFYLPPTYEGDSLSFYFQYSLASVGDTLEPSADYYRYKYGNDFVSHNTKNINYVFTPKKFYLSNNYPNPFNSQTKVKFDLPYDSQVQFIVYDILGRKVKVVANKFLTKGFYTQTIRLNNFSSGVYFLVLKTSKDFQVKKMILLK